MWLSKYEYTTLKNLFPKFKEKVKRVNAGKILNDLLFNSKVYRHIHEPTFKDWSNHEYELARSLEALNSFRVTQQTPMVLSVLREYELKNMKLKHTAEILQSIEHFHYIFTAVTSQRSSGGIGTMYAKYARDLYQAKNTDKLKIARELQGKLRDKIPSFDEFKVNFAEIYFTN